MPHRDREPPFSASREPRRIDDDVTYELGRWAVTMATLLGTDVVDALGTFAREASEGSTFVVRYRGDGFEAQVSGPIVHGEPRLLSVSALSALARGLD